MWPVLGALSQSSASWWQQNSHKSFVKAIFNLRSSWVAFQEKKIKVSCCICQFFHFASLIQRIPTRIALIKLEDMLQFMSVAYSKRLLSDLSYFASKGIQKKWKKLYMQTLLVQIALSFLALQSYFIFPYVWWLVVSWVMVQDSWVRLTSIHECGLYGGGRKNKYAGGGGVKNKNWEGGRQKKICRERSAKRIKSCGEGSAKFSPQPFPQDSKYNSPYGFPHPCHFTISLGTCLMLCCRFFSPIST